jgi:putative ABC transport system ATP-binding protein
MPTAAPVLQLQALRFRWPGADRDLLQVDDLRVDAAERVLLRGESGGGKSTLLSLAAGVLLPQHGDALLLGRSWRALGAGSRDRIRADHVGYIFQQFNLLPYLSVRENVLLPCRFSRLRAGRCASSGGAHACAARLLEALEISAALHSRHAGELSVGQQQRVAAARALIGQPALIVADEPTSALDEGRRDAFMSLLLRECEASGSALLFVSHDDRLAGHFARVVDLACLNGAARPAQAAA